MRITHFIPCLLGSFIMLPLASLPSYAASFLNQPERYSITDLGPGNFSRSNTLDEAGNVVVNGRLSNDQGQRLEAKVIERLVTEGGPTGLREFRRDEIVNPDGSRQSLGTLGGDDPNFLGGTSGSVINNQGAVIGTATTFPFSSTGVWWTEETGLQSRGLDSANDLNDAGIAVGSSVDNFGRAQASRYELGSDRAEPLPEFRDSGIGRPVSNGLIETTALGISNNGRIVGTTIDIRAVRFTETTTEDLNRFIDLDSGWFLTEAVDVNDAGQIVGNGQLNGEQRQFLLTPINSEPHTEVPEPSLLLSLLAVAGLCGRKRSI